MPEVTDVLNEMNVAMPETSEPENTDGVEQTDPSDISEGALNARLEGILDPQKEKPAEENTEKSETPEKPAEGSDKDKPDEKPDEFLTASRSALNDEDGNISSEKVQDLFLNTGKSFLQFAEAPKPDVQSVEQKEDVVSPETEYIKAVDEIVSNLPSILKEEREAGITPEQTIQRLANTLGEFVSKRDSKLELAKERESLRNEYRSDIEKRREKDIDAAIDKNTAVLGSHLNDTIPGVKGVDVLNKFLLDKKYGGKMLDMLFRKENPGYDSLKPEDQKATINKWFRGFQANRSNMSMVAEYGRAMWLLERLPDVVEHAKAIGTTLKETAGESKGTKPSGMKSSQPAGGMSKRMSEFLGYDQVN